MKNELHFDQVDLIVIDPARAFRNTLSDMLKKQGFNRITLGATLADLNTKMSAGTPDLLITDDHLPDGNLCEFIQKLRHNYVGTNPFVSIIATTWEPDQNTVRSAMQAGTDDFLVKPLSPSVLLRHITEQVQHRKPFVVTSAYIGPDRRGEDERLSEIELLNVPNTLMEKSLSIRDLDPSNIQNEISAYIKIVNIYKLNRHADQIQLLVERSLAALAGGKGNAEGKALLKHLLFIAKDTALRMADTPYAHVSVLCGSLIETTENVLACVDAPLPKDMQLLPQLAQAIRKGFDESSDEVTRTVSAISESVSLHY